MSADPVPGRIRWIALSVVAAVAAAGALPQNPNAPLAAAGAVIAVLGAALLVHGGRPPLLYAAVATAGIAVEGHGLSNDIGWLAVCLIAGWCVVVVSRRDGLIYWAAVVLLLGAEWVWIRPDPGAAAVVFAFDHGLVTRD